MVANNQFSSWVNVVNNNNNINNNNRIIPDTQRGDNNGN